MRSIGIDAGTTTRRSRRTGAFDVSEVGFSGGERLGWHAHPRACMAVVGNGAWIGGTIKDSNDPSYIGMGSWWHVTDNGQGANDPPDITTFLGIGSLEETQAFCDDYPPYKHPFANDGGNIKVSSS